MTASRDLADALAIAHPVEPGPGRAWAPAAHRLAVALPIGVWVDRWDRRTLIVAANLLRGAALLVLAVTVQFGVSSLVVLYAAMAVVGALESMADSAAVAMLPSLVDRKHLDSANGRVAAAQLVCDEFAGPPLGGILFALAAAAPVFAMGGLWASAGLVALALPIRRSPQPRADAPPARRPVSAEAREGIAWLARHRVVGILALIGALASVGYMLPFSILVLFAEERLGLNGTGYGLLLAFSALGGLLGSFLAPRLRTWLGYRWTIVTSLLLGALTLGGLAATTDPVLAGVLLALYILHAVVWSICALSLRQRLVPDALLGRVGGAARVLSLLRLAVGSALGGMLGAIDLTIPVAAGAAVFAGCCLLAAVTLRGELAPDDHSVVAIREVDAELR
ncbi:MULTISPECIES: MFS transporter [unclassified Microbacterium]|uniref:MFS transporter n=1 Tax=unclassified Microbacterium TaxID=2609290 RepID=UPI00214D0E25|nr:MULTISPECIES: MFS transporter [unclassified Microbacterium]MCR2784160.1 MFS transporter [Microbacterium sp. zg.B96]WIM15006.1 MFS transporter [Microbacterium sp. zg-B96]